MLEILLKNIFELLTRKAKNIKFKYKNSFVFFMVYTFFFPFRIYFFNKSIWKYNFFHTINKMLFYLTIFKFEYLHFIRYSSLNYFRFIKKTSGIVVWIILDSLKKYTCFVLSGNICFISPFVKYIIWYPS